MHIGLVYAEMDVFCLVIMVMIGIVTITQSKRLVNQSLYLFMMLFAMILVTSDMLYQLSSADIINVSMFWLYFYNALYFISSIMISLIWFIFSRRDAGEAYPKKWIIALTCTPAGIGILLIFLNNIDKLIFYIDESGTYFRGPANIIPTLISLLYFWASTIFAVADYLRLRSALALENMKSALLFAFFPLAAVGIQLVYVGAPFLCIGAVLGMLWVFIFKISSERTRFATEQLVSEAKSQFFASMSHEIRTPINSVLGMNTMILRESRDPVITGYAQTVDNSGRMLLSIVNDILDFSKAETGQLSLTIAEYEPADMICELIELAGPLAKTKNLRFTAEINPQLPSVLCGDDIRIRQIIVNLLTNAVKYTEHGEVKLKVSYQDDGDYSIRLKVSVIDTGKGIRQEDIASLFSPYKRFNEESNRAIEGSGLGLSIVKMLLKLMDSELIVNSEYGAGSTFSFEIIQPVRSHDPIGSIERHLESRAQEKSTNRTVSSLRLKDARVLVVDDLAVNIEVFKALIKHTGIGIDTAMSGPAAIQLCCENAYDCIFMDHMMPGMDGIEAFHGLKDAENTLNADTPVIILTANVVAGYREQFLSEGFDDFLAKPVTEEFMDKMLKKHLDSRLIKKI